MHILLAEDNEANRILVRSLLEREGHILDFAPNGSIALMCCEDKKYDLILMDILMPIMDGVKTLRRLRRSDNCNANTPVFALTGYSSATDKRHYEQAGFDLVLTKPLRPNDLAQAWSNYLKGEYNIAPAPTETSLKKFGDIPLIEDEMIEQLLISGTPDNIRRISKSFWSSALSSMSSIHDNLSFAMRGQNEALSALRRSVHGIKGASANLGLLRLSRIAASLQNAPPETIGSLVISLTEAIKPSEEALEHRISQEEQSSNIDSAEVHFGDVNARIEQGQTLPSQSESQSPHKRSAVEAPQRQARAP